MDLLSEKIRDHCRQSGIQNCSKRLIVANTLQKITTSTAEDVWLTILEQRVRISIGAVYLNLNWLVKNGYAEKSPGSDNKMVYKLSSNS